jgi:hypothetical protein
MDDVDNVEYSAIDEQFMNQFKVFCKIRGYKIPQTDTEIIRHLKLHKMQNQKTYDSIFKLNGFSQELFPVEMSEKAGQLLENGGIYIQGYDSYIRPIVVVQVAKLIEDGDTTTQDVVSLAVFVFEFIMKYMFKTGKVQSTQLLIDCHDTNSWSMPYSMLKTVYLTINQMYQHLITGIHIVNVPTSFGCTWAVSKLFIDEQSSAKVQISPNNIP